MPELAPVNTTRFVKRGHGTAHGNNCSEGSAASQFNSSTFFRTIRVRSADALQMVPRDAGIQLLDVLLALDVQKGRAQHGDAACGASIFDGGNLQHVLTPARLRLRIGMRVSQALDAYLQQQLVLEHERILGGALFCPRVSGHPVAALLGNSSYHSSSRFSSMSRASA